LVVAIATFDVVVTLAKVRAGAKTIATAKTSETVENRQLGRCNKQTDKLLDRQTNGQTDGWAYLK
jgi:hypothetical protein